MLLVISKARSMNEAIAQSLADSQCTCADEVTLASPSCGLQPRSAGPFPGRLLEELCSMEGLSGLAGPTQARGRPLPGVERDGGDWRALLAGGRGLAGSGAGGGADIPEAAAAAAEPV
ncbi:hypothetical protein VULLAG_LOCUS9407 [Vulpes lagopus]